MGPLALMLVIIGVSTFGSGPARADAGMAAAAVTANGGLSACAANTGKALYDCVANVLDKLSNDITAPGVPETRRALSNAAAKLRAATSKAQALSAVTQCRALITSALAKVRALGGGYVAGWGGGAGAGSGLAAVSDVLARAAKLIQSKG
ncbi:hypothetical protein SSBR45G_35810 [Bradyrhizobium sp. SSBR45G]|uniref:hypothetical protein n=1 Tax=unclassified Bradyrhizobium TaxID=2631580 RepID=UPI002342B541|nr:MULTISPECIES: hypothetical protein [unclassified Bradyrhizobium]GLH78672.1 hypothetical protein SSBR45G_35810 [Bradyrhizobium sp. SSBR45G]GLH87500.1 hypothetical protein SSBR45R_49600 [Bradyrhizobium sp. SSBR45R]